MMASPSGASSSKKEIADNPAVFVSITKEYPILLGKSCIPSMRDKRNKAIEDIQLKIEEKLEVSMDSNKILKKLNNMKTRVKAKADTNKTGNKKIVLKPWEEELLKFIEGDMDNPSIVRLKGAVSAGMKVSRYLNDSDEDLEHTSDSTSLNLPSTSSSVKEQEKKQDTASDERSVAGITSPKQIKKKAKLSESEDTKYLSLPQLQRMVLLKQLDYFKKAEKLIDIKLKREKSKEQGQELLRNCPVEVNAQNLSLYVLAGEEVDNYILENL